MLDSRLKSLERREKNALREKILGLYRTFTDEALKYIAKNFTNNVRELEGAFNKVRAYAEIDNEELSLAFAKSILKCEDNDSELSFDKILEVVAQFYDVDINDIKGTAKGQKTTIARHMSVYLSRELTNKSFTAIAEFYNKKHTTIMYAYEKIKKDIATSATLASAVREIKQALKVI